MSCNCFKSLRFIIILLIVSIVGHQYNIFYILDATVSNSVHVLGIQPICRNKENVFQEYLSKKKIFLSIYGQHNMGWQNFYDFKNKLLTPNHGNLYIDLKSKKTQNYIISGSVHMVE